MHICGAGHYAVPVSCPPAPLPSTAGLEIRSALPADKDTVLAIRADAIRSSAALWIDDQPAPAEADAWFDEHLQSGSLLVAVDAGADAGAGAETSHVPGMVLGFATFGPLRDYAGYRFTAEDSVYLRPQAQGQGVGGRLLDALVDRAGELGMHSMCAFIEAGNAASIRLHVRAGFTEVGRIPQAGTKFGRWLDLVIMQRLLTLEDAASRD